MNTSTTHTNTITNQSLYIAQRLTKRELFVSAHAKARTMGGDYRKSFAKALKALYSCVLVINTVSNKARVMVQTKAQELVAKFTKADKYDTERFSVGSKRPLVGNIYLQKKTYGWTIQGTLANGKEIYTSVTNYQVETHGGIKNAMKARLERCIAGNYDYVAFNYRVAVEALTKAGK